MASFALDTELGALPAELARRGLSAHTRVHITVEILADQPTEADLQMTKTAADSRAFDWLHDEPDLYNDADLQR